MKPLTVVSLVTSSGSHFFLHLLTRFGQSVLIVNRLLIWMLFWWISRMNRCFRVHESWLCLMFASCKKKTKSKDFVNIIYSPDASLVTWLWRLRSTPSPHSQSQSDCLCFMLVPQFRLSANRVKPRGTADGVVHVAPVSLACLCAS